MTSIIYQFLTDHINIKQVDLLRKLVDYTINVVTSNQDDQVCILECLNGLKTLTRNDRTGGDMPTWSLSRHEAPLQPVAKRFQRIGRLGDVNIERHNSTADDVEYQLIIEKIILRICYPVFKCIKLERNATFLASRRARDCKKWEAFQAACELCQTCLSMCSKAQPKSFIYDACIRSLKVYVEEQRFSEIIKLNLPLADVIPIYQTLEILNAVLEYRYDADVKEISLPYNWLDTCIVELLNIIEHGENSVCGQVVTILMPKILKICATTNKNTAILWTRIKQILLSLSNQDDDHKNANSFVILCAFVDYFHPKACLLNDPEMLANLLSERLFWQAIQNGFIDGDALTRKRALYLLKRVVELSEGKETFIDDRRGSGSVETTEIPLFHRSQEENKAALSKIWSDIILVLETLEETQIHVVMPVLSRLSKLIKATYPPSSGWPLLHTSWLVVIFNRLFQHGTKTISRWGVMQAMRLDLFACPILTQVGSKFVLGPILNALSDYTLYINTTERSQSRFSDVSEMMLGFFASCVASLPADHSKVFLQELLSAIVDLQTKQIPLGFLCRSLAAVPVCKSWGDESLQCLRELLSSGISTVTPLLRGAIQCSLMDVALNLTDAAAVSLCRLVSVFATLNREECMRRGTILWDKIVRWLQLNLSELNLRSETQSLFEAVKLEVTEYTTSFTDGTLAVSSAKEATRVARMLLLIVDANYRAKNQLLGGHSLTDLIHPLTEVLQAIGSHVYLPVSKADRALQLLLAILDEADPIKAVESDLQPELEKFIFGCVDETCLYLTRRLNVMDNSETIDESSLQLYICILDRLLGGQNHQPGGDKLITHCIAVVKKALDLTSQNEILRLIACTRVLGWKLLSAISAATPLNATISRSIGPINVFAATLLNVGRFRLECANRCSLINTFLSSKWSSVLYFLRMHPVEVFASRNPEVILAACLSDLSLVQGLEVLPGMQCVKLLVAQVINNPSSCLEALDVCWNVVRDSKNHQKVYWPCLEAFVEVAFQVDLMKSDNEVIVEKLHKIANDCFVAGENQQGLVNVLTNRMCESLLSFATDDASICVATALRYLEVLVNFYLFCPALNKELRLLHDVSAWIVEKGDSSSVNQVFESCNRDHRLVRITAINFIVKLQTDHPSILQGLAPHMIQSLLRREKNESAKNKYVCNSDRHKLKEKMWQTILLLLPCVQLQTAQEIFPQILDSLAMDNQPSVRYFQEWVIITLMERFAEFQQNLWHLLQQATKTGDWNRNQVSSLITILSHLGTITVDRQKKVEFHKKALPLMLSFCLSKNFSIQLYAQASLSKLWAECEASGLDDVQAMYPAVAACVEFQNTSSEHFSILGRLQSNFFLLKFHPQHDFNFETIFYTIPYLSLMMPEQLIPPDMFVEANEALWARSDLPYNLKPSCDREGLRGLVPGAWKATKVKHTHSTVGEDGGVDGGNADDVQKKIMPMCESIPGLEVDALKRMNPDRSKLIFVTSLVNKVPNLGGLCRSSEIFGVGTVILPNIKMIETKEFQNLSVTAQKWLNIEEVRPYDLKDYLVKKRHEGYLLVGLEQTANSKCLNDCKFPPETLIVLGNERSGIPVELINILDVCVKIPQLGVLRSLNVHVSGALVVWEYTKQCMMS